MSQFKPLQIGDCTIGGPLGSHTGLLVGSIFYDNHSIVTDAFSGSFNEEKAAGLIDRVNALAVQYGVQMAFDVIGSDPDAFSKFIRFTAERTSLPLLLNATEAEVRVAGLATAAELGVLGRCIFASLNEDTEDQELEALRRHRPAGVMILANDVGDPTPEGSCNMIEKYFRPMLDDIGVETPIVDLGVMDAPSVGIAMRGIQAVRERFGYPAGCAFSNCFPQWTGLSSLGREWVNLSLATALVCTRMAGGDFLHYGIIEKCRMAAHALGSAEVFLGFAAQEIDGHPLPDGHALLKMFKLAEAA
ncbi:tetrahydromethanopterin S-methyltransferase subunit H family protein [Aminobacter ciceronei]|uniref:Tetrahydromethanopterin S-methyltransferase subunit H n=1 Tax=Aminobacter ciceronei TaxID=150723 RepID=A0ABR6CAI5_9HYPH|nr:tetrahydromethanopterin S-methyltransferase subunit H [Aminobacter ciceronei]MBA8907986.1 tetrahydromethanopterin S-methyltransferase subunit H [Aminobacter ciceronei]MBA9021741.1 tetrahydromethanopterin S-methyltransferase subunit H [Aminobacter ciceronei]